MMDTLDCKTVSRMISEGLDRDLPGPERVRLRYHFVLCEACRNVDEQMSFLRRAIRQMDKDPPADS